MSKLQARHKPGAQAAPVGAIAWKREEQAWPEAGVRLVGQDPEGRAGCRGAEAGRSGGRAQMPGVGLKGQNSDDGAGLEG